MGHDWVCAENYNLSIDTSLFPLEELAEIIIELLKQKGIVTLEALAPLVMDCKVNGW
jgi:hypothetical protein